jgi:hypothetical protein
MQSPLSALTASGECSANAEEHSLDYVWLRVPRTPGPFMMSRTVVCDALAQLKAEDLVRTLGSSRGTFVTRPEDRGSGDHGSDRRGAYPKTSAA